MTQAGPTQQWRQLVAAAVLGADRAGARLPTVDGAPAKLLAQKGIPGPGRLLQMAAVLSVYERAGRRPGEAARTLPVACEEDATPACSFCAGQHLARILQGEFGYLLDEWCALAAQRGVRAADELLPTLLDRLAGDRTVLDRRLSTVLGRRGQWLATLNPAWKGLAGASADDPRELWKTGETTQRLALLRQLRGCDPGAARELVTLTWDQESGDERARIVQALSSGLSPEDEAFLEAALDDSRKSVRQAAAELLARLPESAFCQRMKTRATMLVRLRVKKGLLRGARLHLEVDLPDKPDKAWLRDGIESKRGGGMGERAQVLSQILAATPLAAWTECGAKAEEIIAVSTATDWRAPLSAGWTEAAARQRSAEWAAPLLRMRLKSEEDSDSDQTVHLVQGLEPAERERIMSDLLSNAEIPLARSVPLLEGCDHAWGPIFSRAALTAMRGYFGTQEAYGAHALRSAFKQRSARCFSPAIANEVETGWNRTDPYWHKGDEDLVAALAGTLAFRRAMQEELS